MIAKKGCNGDQKSSVHCIDSQSMGAAGGPDGKCTVAIGGILDRRMATTGDNDIFGKVGEEGCLRGSTDPG